jgi:MIT (microtubule interacting and transport) domain
MMMRASGRSISDCNVLVANAIAADQAKEYDTAMVLYRTSISMLLRELERKEGSAQQRQHLKQRVNQLLERAEELQRYLDKVKKRNGRPPSTPFSSCKSGQQLVPGMETMTSKPKPDKIRTQRATETERHNNQENVDAGREKGWTFHLDLRFDMQSKIKTPSPSPENKDEKGSFNLMNLLRLLPIGGQ